MNDSQTTPRLTPAASLLLPVACFLLIVRPFATGDLGFEWANLNPLLAVGLVLGVAAPGGWLAGAGLILGARFLADLAILGLTGESSWAFYDSQPFVYAGVALSAAVGFFARRGVTAGSEVGAGLLGGLGAAVLFFLVSNFGVWVTDPKWVKTPAGLWSCYVHAIPFFRNTLTSTVVLSGVLCSRPVLSWLTTTRHVAATEPVRG